MKCTELAERIEQLQPGASAREVARLCLLLSNRFGELDVLSDDGALADAWQEVDLRMRAATDQHAAVTEDLERLQQSDGVGLTSRQFWQLVRTFKVQSQILGLYLSSPGRNSAPLGSE